MIKLGLVAGFIGALLGAGLASTHTHHLLGPVLRPLFGPVDALVTPGVTTAANMRQGRAFRNVVYTDGDEFWQVGETRDDGSRLQVSIATLQRASTAPAKLSQVAILRFDGRTGVLKELYLDR